MAKAIMREMKNTKVFTILLLIALVTATLLVDVYQTSAQRPVQHQLEDIGRTPGH